MSMETINTLAIEADVKKSGFKGKAASAVGADFGNTLAAIDAVSAMEPMVSVAAQQNMGITGQAAVSAAMAGFRASAGTPYMSGAGGQASFSGGFKAAGGADGYGYDPASTLPGDPPGGTGLSQGELMQQMNNNSLNLLTLQAQMQNNMQIWNTRSNILSADHRARMSIVEKFQGR